MTHADIVEGIKRCRHVGECEVCERVLARQERIAMARAIRFAASGAPESNSFVRGDDLRALADRIESGEVTP
jgi:hypothetical protein